MSDKKSIRRIDFQRKRESGYCCEATVTERKVCKAYGEPCHLDLATKPICVRYHTDEMHCGSNLRRLERKLMLMLEF